MERLLFTGLLLMATISGLWAQNTTVRGKVISADGKPIPGAKIEAKGLEQNLLSNPDGTFTCELPQRVSHMTASYAGWNQKTEDINWSDQTITLKMHKSNWWNVQPQHYQWFVGVQGVTASTDLNYNGGGIMFGWMKKIGWFVRGEYSPMPSTSTDYSHGQWTTGFTKKGYYNGTAGFIARLGCVLHAYIGFGYGDFEVAKELANGTWANVKSKDCENVVTTMGLLLKMNHVFLNVGAVVGDDGDEAEYTTVHAGLGYFF
jgi:hypothetical protein